MSVKITNHDFIKRVHDMYGDEYTVLSEYTKAIEPVKMRHNKCSHPSGVFEYWTTPHSIKCGKKCPYESHQQGYGIEDVQADLDKNHPGYKVLDKEYKNSQTKMWFKCDKEHEFQMTQNMAHSGQGCPYCSNRKVLAGFNDLATINPKAAQHLVDSSDGKKYAAYTRTKLRFQCPQCGHQVYCIPYCALNSWGEFNCPNCADGYSYPEKFIHNMLVQSGADFIYQLTSAKADWAQNYRYDFYLPEINSVVEVQGNQHYISEAQIDNDQKKYLLAKENGVGYITIDARVSDMNYIRNSVLSSDLTKYMDLTTIDWQKCNWHGIHSKTKIAIDKFNAGQDPLDIAKDMNVLPETIYGYLEKGSLSGQCTFNKTELKRKHQLDSVRNAQRLNQIKVKCVETGEVYESKEDARKRAGAHLNKSVVNNPNRTSAGFHWVTA